MIYAILNFILIPLCMIRQSENCKTFVKRIIFNFCGFMEEKMICRKGTETPKFDGIEDIPDNDLDPGKDL